MTNSRVGTIQTCEGCPIECTTNKASGVFIQSTRHFISTLDTPTPSHETDDADTTYNGSIGNSLMVHARLTDGKNSGRVFTASADKVHELPKNIAQCDQKPTNTSCSALELTGGVVYPHAGPVIKELIELVFTKR